MKYLCSLRRQIGGIALVACLLACLLPAAAESYQYTSPYVEGVTYTLDYDPDEMALGIDVSYYQGTIDWEAVAADGIEFAFIRAAVRYSSSGTLAVDSKFYENIEGALASGIKVGVYIFSQAVSVEEAVEEADFLIDLVDGYDIDLPLVFDPEFLYSQYSNAYYGRLYEAFSELDAADRVNYMTELGNAFFTEVEEAGYIPMYYSSYSWLMHYVDTSALSTPVWLARYNTYAGYPYDYAFWQYTGKGTVDGISTDVDCSFCFDLDYLDCQTLAGNKTEPTTSDITINPTSYPTGTMEAATFALKGTVTSNYPLESVTGTITAADGTVVQTYTANPYTTRFTISGSRLDVNLKFADLSAGEYTLTYTATDTEGYSVSWTSDPFTVTVEEEVLDPSTSTIAISPTSYPTGNLSARAFTLKGTVSSNYELTSVTGSILYLDGTAAQSVTQEQINSTTFTIQNSDIDKGLKFANLSAGYYRLSYTAVDASGATVTWTSDVFAVADTTLFADVTDSGTWYYDTVYQVANLGSFNGYTDSNGTVTFKPDQLISRIEVITTLYRLAGSPEVTGAHPFTDATGLWYQDALTWAYQQGIATGISTTAFDPNSYITREAFAALLYRYCGGTPVETDYLSDYTDVETVSDWAVTAVNWCVANGVIHSASTTELLLSPLANTNRATAAQLLYNFSVTFGTDYEAVTPEPETEETEETEPTEDAPESAEEETEPATDPDTAETDAAETDTSDMETAPIEETNPTEEAGDEN